MEGREEASDTESGIMLHSGPGSPVSPLKELAQRVRRQQQALEACVQELRRLCLREAELTGTLPREFPLKAGEKPPKVRRRIGAAFKLDETLVLRGADPLSALERDLALQLQIAKAAHRLCREENISKQLRRRRKTAALKEEKKLKELENTLSQCRLLAGHRPLPASGSGGAQELSASDESSLSDAVLLEEEETQLPGPGTPRGSPSPSPSSSPSPRPRSVPEECSEAEGPGHPPTPASPWRETSLDGPYEKAKKAGDDPGDSETWGSRCCPTSPPAVTTAPGSPDLTVSLAPRVTDVPPYRFVPIRTLVLRRQAGSSAPSTPEPPSRRGQSQSLRVEARWEPGEPRGRSTAPRRRPTYYTVTVPTSCLTPPGPTHRSGSDDSISDVSSISHATSPGSSSPDVSFPRPPAPPPLTEPGYYPRGAPRLLPPSGPPAFLYEQDLAPLRYQRLVPSHSRIVRTPSLKDYAPVGARGLSKAAVTEELKSWHQRARLRGARPHSLDRQGAFRGPRGGTPRDGPPIRGAPLRAQAPPIRVLRRSPDGVPVQVYVPENGEIVTQEGRRDAVAVPGPCRSARWGWAGAGRGAVGCGWRRRRGGAPGSDRAPPGCGVTAGLRRHRAPPGTGTGTGTGAAPAPPHRPRPRSPRPGRPQDGARWPRWPLAPGRDRAGGRCRLAGGGRRGLPVVRGQERLVAPRLRLQLLHLLLRHVPPAVLLPRPAAPHHRAPAAPLPRLQPQDHRGHRLGRGALHRHRHHHRLLLHVLLLLPLPAPAAPPHPPARPRDPPGQLPHTPPSPIPCGPQSRPRAPPAWLHPHGHVPAGRPRRPVPDVPLWTPRLQPHSTTALRPCTAQLPRSLSPLGDPASTGDTLGHPWVASEHGLGAPVVVPPPQAVTPPYEADGWIWPFPAIVGTRSTEPLLSPRPPRTLGPLWVPAGSSGPTHGGAMPGVPLPAGTGGALWDPRSPRTLGSSQAGGIKLCPPPRVVSCWWLCAPCPRSNGEGRGAQFFFFLGGGAWRVSSPLPSRHFSIQKEVIYFCPPPQRFISLQTSQDEPAQKRGAKTTPADILGQKSSKSGNLNPGQPIPPPALRGGGQDAPPFPAGGAEQAAQAVIHPAIFGVIHTPQRCRGGPARHGG